MKPPTDSARGADTPRIFAVPLTGVSPPEVLIDDGADGVRPQRRLRSAGQQPRKPA